MSLSFTLDGGNELSQLLAAYPRTVQEKVLNASVSAGATLVIKRARRNLVANGSVRTGNLYGSLKKEKVKRTVGVYRVFTAWPKGAHAHLVEYGTGPRILKEPRLVRIGSNLVTITHTGSAPAKPFLRPAIDEGQREIIAAIGKRFVKRLEAESAKLAARYGTMKSSYKRSIAK